MTFTLEGILSTGFAWLVMIDSNYPVLDLSHSTVAEKIPGPMRAPCDK